MFDALLETLAGRDRSADMIDSTVVRAHYCAAGIQKEAGPSEGLGRSRGGFPTRLHARCDARGLPPGFVLAPGQAHDIQGFSALFRMIESRARMLPADRSYDANAVRAKITLTGTRAAIPARRGRRAPALHSQPHDTWGNRIGRMSSKLRTWRRIATRYGKTAASYLGLVSIASALLWIGFVHGLARAISPSPRPLRCLSVPGRSPEAPNLTSRRISAPLSCDAPAMPPGHERDRMSKVVAFT